MITDLQELLKELNKEPDEVKEGDDGAKFVPISVVQNTLDDLFGFWTWVLEREQFGKSYATGQGILTVGYPKSGSENFYLVTKSGTAGVSLTGDMKLDYPRLEAMTLLNAAKKLGKRLGRDLNRNNEDAPLPVTQLRNQPSANEEDESYNSTLELVKEATTKEQALSILVNSEWRYHKELKEIANSKP